MPQRGGYLQNASDTGCEASDAAWWDQPLLSKLIYSSPWHQQCEEGVACGIILTSNYPCSRVWVGPKWASKLDVRWGKEDSLDYLQTGIFCINYLIGTNRKWARREMFGRWGKPSWWVVKVFQFLYKTYNQHWMPQNTYHMYMLRSGCAQRNRNNVVPRVAEWIFHMPSCYNDGCHDNQILFFTYIHAVIAFKRTIRLAVLISTEP